MELAELEVVLLWHPHNPQRILITKTKEFVMMNILVSLIRFNARSFEINVNDQINDS